MNNVLPERKNIRLKNFDYSSNGAYFITLCTHNRKCTLSTVGAIHESPEISLTKWGKIVDDIITHIPDHLKVTVDRYVIMPNHIHLIVIINNDEETRAIHESPLRSRSILSKFIGYFKMNASKEIHRLCGDAEIWQRGFYDHIIRNRDDYQQIAKYIHENPRHWYLDELYSKETE